MPRLPPTFHAPPESAIWTPLMLQFLMGDYFGANSILGHFSKVVNTWFLQLQYLNFNHGFTHSKLSNLQNYFISKPISSFVEYK